jgi:hypothetical protein
MQPQVEITEIAEALYADLTAIYRSPGRRLFIFFKEIRLGYRLAVKEALYLFPTDTFFFVKAGEVTDCRNHPLLWTSHGSGRLDQRPVVILRAVLFSCVPTKIHVPIIHWPGIFDKGLVSTITGFERTGVDFILPA